MPIIKVNGDLLSSDCHVIAHGCNCFNNMGSGIAYAIKNRFPKAWEADFFGTTLGDKNKLGTFTKAKEHNKVIYNLYSQYSYGHNKMHLIYNELKKALIAMKNDLIKEDMYEHSKIGFPLIGCGLAKGSWEKVSAIIEDIFSDKDVYVYILEKK